MPGALLTDLYELNMAASYLRRGMTAPATFSLYVRNLPAERGFAVAVGIDDCLDYLEDLRFTEDDLAYLRDEQRFDDGALAAFRDLRFTGEVWAVPEGAIVHSSEPVLEVTAPIPEAQLVESALLNLVTFPSTVASKAARYRIAAEGRDLVDFALRRTPSPDASLLVARSSAIVGFVATSNVEAARRFGLRVAGTMAHSYVEAFPAEADAFRAFAEDFPDRTTFLVDTYDTIEGVGRAIEVIRELGLSEGLGVRLDSGDLDALSREARRTLDRAGLSRVRIFASGGIDEADVERLVDAGAPIDAFGIGTRMGVSADAPILDTVYKLVRYGDRPVMKLSAAKETAPDPKQVYRGREGDVLALRDEPAPSGSEPLLEVAIRDGRRERDEAGIPGARATFERDLDRLPAGARRLRQPEQVEVRTSDALRRLTEEVRGTLR